jgi:hypothetical protein
MYPPRTAEHELVHVWVIAHGAQPLLDHLDRLGPEDLDHLVAEVAVGASRHIDGVLDADPQGLFQAGGDCGLAELPHLGEASSSEDLAR